MDKCRDPGKDFALFSENSLFTGLSKEEIESLFSRSSELILSKGEYLMKEGEEAEEIFFLMEGLLEVQKYDPQFKEMHVIDTLSPGDTVGELAILNQKDRSASVKTLARSRLRSISRQKFLEFTRETKETNSFYYQLLKNMAARLHHTTNLALEATREKLHEYRVRSELSLLFILILTVICIFTYGLEGIKYLMSIAPHSSMVSLPLTFSFLFCVLMWMRFSSLSWSDFGLTLNNWKQAVFEGIVFPIPIIGATALLKLLLMHVTEYYAHSSFFDPYSVLSSSQYKKWYYLLAFDGLFYIFIVAPIQEFLSRGVLQNLLERLLNLPYKRLMAIVFSNLIFSTVHLFFSVSIGLVTFFGGLFFGWLYSRTHNLLGCWIAHCILGIWGLAVINP